MSAVYRNLGEGANPAKPPRLLDRMRQVLRTKHYAYSTEQAYVQWARRYIFFTTNATRRRWGGVKLLLPLKRKNYSPGNFSFSQPTLRSIHRSS